MMDALLEHVRVRWPSWFPDQALPELEVAVISKRDLTPPRLTALVASPGERRPAVVLKLAFLDEDTGFLELEHAALCAVRSSIPPHLRPTVPKPLGLEPVAGLLVESVVGVGGRSPLVLPMRFHRSVLGSTLLRRYLRVTFEWTRKLAVSTGNGRYADERELVGIVDDFTHLMETSGASTRGLEQFRRELNRSQIRWQPCWQHGDLAPGNVLLDRRYLVVLDWEFARSDCEPWFDTAYNVLGLALQPLDQGIAKDAATSLLMTLSTQAWKGRATRDVLLESWAWPLPPAWVLPLTGMKVALRDEAGGRSRYLRWGHAVTELLTNREVRQSAAWIALGSQD
jgi:hypothetical protein